MRETMSSKYAVSYLREHGFVLPEQSEIARAWCLDRAQKGDVDAQCVVSTLFASGLGGSVDEIEALKWCKTASANGSKDAQCALAAYLISGRGGERQPDRGVALIRELVNGGHLPAMVSLGVLMLTGHSEYVAKDEDAAIDLLLGPAHAGDALSQCLVGSQLTLSKDPATQQAGARWIALAAEGGLPTAHGYLANFYRQGDYGYPIDAERALAHEAMAQRLEAAAPGAGVKS